MHLIFQLVIITIVSLCIYTFQGAAYYPKFDLETRIECAFILSICTKSNPSPEIAGLKGGNGIDSQK